MQKNSPEWVEGVGDAGLGRAIRWYCGCAAAQDRKVTLNSTFGPCKICRFMIYLLNKSRG